MQQPGITDVSHRSRGIKSPIFRAGNITNSIIVVGDNNRLSINAEGNAILDRLLENQRPIIQRRPPPVIIGRPKHPINLLNRDREKNNVLGALQPGNCTEFYSEAGFGKTTLLRFFSSISPMPDGMVFIDRWKSLDDLLQELFDAFFNSSQGYKPGQVGYKRYFENIRAFIILDNFSLTREETQILLDTVPNCVFLMASNERHLWERGNAIHLTGLPLDEAITLFQQQSGRKISRSELPFVKSICNAFQGNPLHIIQAAAQVRDEKISVQKVARKIPGAKPEIQILEGVLKQLSDEAKALLALLATFGNAPLPAEHIASILQNPHLAPLLKDLLNRGLIKAHSPSYSLTGSIGNYLNQSWNLAGWKESAITHFANWTAYPRSNEQILDAADALMVTLENAAAANRWQEVLQIGVAIEPAFVLGRRWGIWKRLLNLLRKAGTALKDRAIQAWTLHQLGSQALGLGNLPQAKELLSGSLAIRRAIGDRSGASATRHNLKLLRGGPPTGSKGGPAGRGWIIPIIGIVIIIIVIAVPKKISYPPGFFTEPPLTPPSFTPVTPPSNTPLTPPSFTPVTPPSNTPLTPSSNTPLTPPSITPVTPPSYTPVTPPSYTPVTPPTPMPVLSFKVNLPPEKIILYQGISNDFFEVPVNINITNPSSNQIPQLDISVHFNAFDGGHTTDFRIYNKNSYQSSVSISLAPSEVRGFRVYVRVPKSYNGRTIRLISEASQCKTYNTSFECSISETKLDMPKVVYDFVDSADNANWYGYETSCNSFNTCTDYTYPLSFNGDLSEREKGSARLDSGLTLEDSSQPFFVLGTHPTWLTNDAIEGIEEKNGRIEGWYFPSSLQVGDRFFARVGFVTGAGGDGVDFKLQCTASNLLPQTNLVPQSNFVSVSYNFNNSMMGGGEIFSLYDRNDARLKDVDVLIPDSLINSCRQYILVVDAKETSAQDWAVWVSAFIVRP